ncbi:MAG: colanic acid biosynthesis glycosyltransferase WcaI [Calditrichaeota bacterium]|nr:MAG: colanic acid biosynthesis glycosyltransferase WcaI [Calditrichota bacterium]
MPVMLRQIFWKPDVVFVVEPPLFCAPAAWIVARLSGGKCWLHVQDFEVDAAFSLGLLPGWLSGVTAGIERWLMRRFDSASTISEAMRLRLREKGGRSPVLFPNWADPSEMQRDSDGASALRASLGISPDQLVCLYSGNIAEKQGLELILETAGLVPEALFLICGQGPALPGLREKARTNGLKNVRFLSLQPKEKLPALLSMADIHLVVQKRGAADLVMPSKLANILAVGGITVVTAEPETELGRMAEGDAACVYRCDPEDPRVLAQAIRHLLRNEDRCDELKRKARLYAARMIAKDHVLREFERRLIALSGGERS